MSMSRTAKHEYGGKPVLSLAMVLALALSGTVASFYQTGSESSSMVVSTSDESRSGEHSHTLSQPDPSTPARLSEAYGNRPLSFEANRGQTDSQVKFLSRGNGYDLYLTPAEAVLEWRNADGGMRIGENKNPKSKIQNRQWCA
jgi:hypothetical protein